MQLAKQSFIDLLQVNKSSLGQPKLHKVTKVLQGYIKLRDSFLLSIIALL